MASGSDIRAGGAYVEISAKLDQLKSDLKQGQNMLSGWAKGLTAAGIGAAAASQAFSGLQAGVSVATQLVANAVNTFAEVGSQINDMAARTGIGSDRLQTLGFAAKQTGTSLEAVEMALRTMAKNGMNVSQFEALGQQIAAIQDPSDRARAAIDAFGKSGTKLLPLFAEFKSLKAASAAIGPILTSEEVSRADALGDAFSGLKESVSRLSQQVGNALAPALQEVLQVTIGLTAEMGEFVKRYKDLAQASLGAGAGAALGLAQGTAGAVLGPMAGAAVGALGSAGSLAANSALAGAAARGKAAVQGGLAQPGMATSEEELSVGKKMDETLKGILERNKAISEEYRKRNDLIREFATPHEQFLAKEKQIADAIRETVAAGHAGLGNIDQLKQQVAGLHEALARLREAERERMAAKMATAGVTNPATGIEATFREVMRSSRGTFSAAGAGMIGRGGESALERKADVTNNHLRNIDSKMGKLQKPKFR